MVVAEVTPQVLGILRGLVAGAVRAQEDEPPRGAWPQELDDLQARLGCSLPAVLRIWLSVCRGARIGPGGVFGPRPGDPGLDMASRWDPYPEWAQRGWLPVAGDGCGNYYVLRDDGTVGFVGTMQDPGKIDRQAASDLLSFMIGLLAHDQETGRASSSPGPPHAPARLRDRLIHHIPRHRRRQDPQRDPVRQGATASHNASLLHARITALTTAPMPAFSAGRTRRPRST